MKTTFFCGLFGLFFLAACSKDEIQISGPDMRPNIDWSQLETGQRSTYLFFVTEGYFSIEPGSPQTFTGDTLAVDVIGKEGDKFRMREYLLPGSPALLGKGESVLSRADSVYEYYLYVRNDSLVVESIAGRQGFRTHLFRGGSAEPLPLQPAADLEISFTNWRTDTLCSCYAEGSTSTLVVLGESYSQLFTVIDHFPMAYDGAGQTFTFRSDLGLVRTYAVNPWFDSVSGWDLLP